MLRSKKKLFGLLVICIMFMFAPAVVSARTDANETCVLTYHANNGTTIIETREVEKGKSVEPIRNPFTWEGHIFRGWSTSATGPVEYFRNNISISKDTHLYAIWGKTDSDWQKLSEMLKGSDQADPDHPDKEISVKLDLDKNYSPDDTDFEYGSELAKVKLVIPKNVKVELDLKGHSIDFRSFNSETGLPRKTGEFECETHFGVLGTLILKDTVGGGKITGGAAKEEATISVSENGSFTMVSGEFSSNFGEVAGAIALSDTAFVNLKGGVITNNYGYCGGVVFMPSGDKSIEKPAIFSISGNVRIYDNYRLVDIDNQTKTAKWGPGNLARYPENAGSLYRVAGPFNGEIGVTDIYDKNKGKDEYSLAVCTGLVAEPAEGYTFTASDLACFYSDNDEYVSALNSDGRIELCEADQAHSVTFKDNDKDICRIYVKDGAKAVPPVKPEKSRATFIEWQKDGRKYDFGSEVTGDLVLNAAWKIHEKTGIKPKVTISGWTYGKAAKAPVLAGGSNPGKGKVTYQYFTNAACTVKTTKAGSGAAKTGGVPSYSGSYYVKATVAETEEYKSGTATAVFTIAKAKATVTKAPKAKDKLKCNGKAQALVAAGKSSGGSMVYAVTTKKTAPGAGSYKTGLPKKTTAGTYYVWYKAKGDRNHKDSAAKSVKVSIAKAKITSLKFKKAKVTVDKNEKQTLTVTISPSYASDKSLTWKTSDRSVVTVDQKGNIRGIKAGTATITATPKDGSKPEASCKVTVTHKTRVYVKKITLNVTNKSLKKGSDFTLKATVTPQNASNKGVTWTSSDPGVAVVDKNTGKVTAKAKGTATITALAKDGSGKKAVCKVSVK